MRVLIVDDDPDQLLMLETVFRKRGHEVESTTESLGVIARLAGYAGLPPDVCVLDNYMPALSGIAIVNLAARTPRASSVPLIVYSSDAGVGALLASATHPRASFALKGRVTAIIALAEQAASDATRWP